MTQVLELHNYSRLSHYRSMLDEMWGDLQDNVDAGGVSFEIAIAIEHLDKALELGKKEI